MLLLPAVKEKKVYLIDGDVAKAFFLTELYYPAVESKLEKDGDALRELLEQPAFSKYRIEPESDDTPAE